MRDPVYHELLFKSKEDFERTINFFRPNESDEFVVDFNKIMPVPSYFDEYFSNFSRETILKAAAYYIYETLDIEYDSLTTEDVRKAFTGVYGEPLLYGSTPFISEIVRNSKYYSEIIKKKEKLSDINFPKSFMEVGEMAIKSIVKDNFIDKETWMCYNWSSSNNASKSTFNKDDLTISFYADHSDVFPLMQDLSRKIGITMYYRYGETESFAFAGEVWFSNGDAIEQNSHFSTREMFNIIGSMIDKDGESFRWIKYSSRIVSKEQANPDKWKEYLTPVSTKILTDFKKRK